MAIRMTMKTLAIGNEDDDGDDNENENGDGDGNENESDNGEVIYLMGKLYSGASDGTCARVGAVAGTDPGPFFFLSQSDEWRGGVCPFIYGGRSGGGKQILKIILSLYCKWLQHPIR